MAIFTNYATLSYDGETTVSNTVTGQILDPITATKAAVVSDYRENDNVAYVITLVNSGQTEINGLSVTDDLGAYTWQGAPFYPLAYSTGSIRYYLNGVLQPAPTVTTTPSLVVSGLRIPAGGNAMLIYQANITSYAPLAAEASIINTATITAPGITTPVTVTETIEAEQRADLTISKSLCPSVITESGQLTYTFVIENRGNAAANTAVLADTFNPILNPISVAFNGTAWTEGTQYTYNTTTGEFVTESGQITVPAATFAQNSNGVWVTTPGTSTLVITGTV